MKCEGLVAGKLEIRKWAGKHLQLRALIEAKHCENQGSHRRNPEGCPIAEISWLLDLYK